MASYVPVTNILEFPMAFVPTGAFPIDGRSMFGSYAEAVTAAGTVGTEGSKYYIGMALTVYENDTVKMYQIAADKTLQEVGSVTLTDGKTIEYGDDGKTISLKNFGKEYYAYKPVDKIIASSDEYSYPDSMPAAPVANSYVKIAEAWYKYDGTAWAVADAEPATAATYVKTTGWKAGVQPKAILNAEGNGFEIAWYEPSTTTVEGVSETVSSLQTTVDSLVQNVNETIPGQIETAVSGEETRAKGVESGLRTDVDTNTAAITKLNGDASTDGSVKNQIATAIAGIMNNPDETMNSIQELVDWVNSHNTEATTMSTNIKKNTDDITTINTLLGTALPEGTTATTVIGYIAEAVKAEADRAKGEEGKNATAIANLKTAVEAIDVTAFATKEQGLKADSAVQTVVKGETNGHIAVDGVDVEVYTAPIASTTALGQVQLDGTSITVTDKGVASVAAVDATKITGLDTKLTATQTAATEAANAYTDENAVAKTAIVEDSTKVANSVETASSAKVVSEKLLMQYLEWKTEM